MDDPKGIISLFADLCTDWDDSPLPDEAEPRVALKCRDLREAIATIERLHRVEQNAIRLFSCGCKKHGNLSWSEFEEAGGFSCPMCLTAEVRKLREREKSLRSPAQEDIRQILDDLRERRSVYDEDFIFWDSLGVAISTIEKLVAENKSLREERGGLMTLAVTERERCARIADQVAEEYEKAGWAHPAGSQGRDRNFARSRTASDIAAAIRRGDNNALAE